MSEIAVSTAESALGAFLRVARAEKATTYLNNIEHGTAAMRQNCDGHPLGRRHSFGKVCIQFPCIQHTCRFFEKNCKKVFTSF